MINQAISRKIYLPYMIGFALIIAAFFSGWLANELLPTAGLQFDLGRVESSRLSTEIHPADTKFYNNNFFTELNESSPIANVSSTELHPADQKLSNYIYVDVLTDPYAGLDSVDRKLFNYVQNAGGLVSSGGELHPADQVLVKYINK